MENRRRGESSSPPTDLFCLLHILRTMLHASHVSVVVHSTFHTSFGSIPFRSHSRASDQVCFLSAFFSSAPVPLTHASWWLSVLFVFAGVLVFVSKFFRLQISPLRVLVVVHKRKSWGRDSIARPSELIRQKSWRISTPSHRGFVWSKIALQFHTKMAI